MAKHDENKDIRIISRCAQVNYSNRTITIPKGACIGIRTWARLDFLRNYCKWHIMFQSGIGQLEPNSIKNNNDKKNVRAAKKAAKEHKLTDKRNKPKNKK